jgi:hypothetical protein
VAALLSYFVVFLVMEIAILHRHTGASVAGAMALLGGGKAQP